MSKEDAPSRTGNHGDWAAGSARNETALIGTRNVPDQAETTPQDHGLDAMMRLDIGITTEEDGTADIHAIDRRLGIASRRVHLEEIEDLELDQDRILEAIRTARAVRGHKGIGNLWLI